MITEVVQDRGTMPVTPDRVGITAVCALPAKIDREVFLDNAWRSLYGNLLDADITARYKTCYDLTSFIYGYFFDRELGTPNPDESENPATDEQLSALEETLCTTIFFCDSYIEDDLTRISRDIGTILKYKKALPNDAPGSISYPPALQHLLHNPSITPGALKEYVKTNKKDEPRTIEDEQEEDL
jgi:hypothetical protein